MADFTEDNIVSLSLLESVRLRPQMYFAKCFTEQSLDALPLEAACHALDEVLDGNCSSIEILLAKNSFTLSYNAGVPLRMIHGEYLAEKLMTQMLVCRNMKKHLHVGAEFCELGMAVINMASEESLLETISDGKRGVFKFLRGKLTERSVKKSAGKEHTSIYIKPDAALFNDLKFTLAGVSGRAQQLARQFPQLTVSVNGLAP